MITDTKSLTGERTLNTDILTVLMIHEMLLLQRIDARILPLPLLYFIPLPTLHFSNSNIALKCLHVECLKINLRAMED